MKIANRWSRLVWIARQPWSDGQVAMFGGSYDGLTQWQTLAEHPPALKTIAPMAAAYPVPDSVFLAYQMQWLASVTGRINQLELFLDFAHWYPKYYRRYAGHIPWARLAEMTNSDDRTWKRWLSHPDQDEYWDAMVPAPEDYGRFDIPILTVTSYYDRAQMGALQFYRDHMAHGSEGGKKKHHVLMGPWSHGGTMRPTQTLSGLDFGPESVPYTNFKEFGVLWFDWVMKDGAKPDFLKAPITYYAMGERVWKYADRFEDISNAAATWYLESAENDADDVFRSGMLQTDRVVGRQEPDQFVYDPLDVMSAEEYFAHPPNILNPNWLTEGSGAYEPNILIYHSPPLQRDIDVAGVPVFRAYIELNVPDTDFHVRLFEIRPDGAVIWLGETYGRARYRNSRATPELVEPGTVQLYEFKDFLFVERRIPKGSRLQLILSGLNRPDYQKNYNSGGDIAWETAEDARTAVIRLHHDERYPSALELPLWE